MTISLIAAIDKNRGIGINNSMPWYIKDDFEWFRFHTLHKTVVMGSNTLLSIGSPLKGRDNIVLSRTYKSMEGVKVLSSVEDVLAYTATDREVMVIGGASIYEQFLPFATRLYLTEIEKEFECDTFFPEFDRNTFIRYYHTKGQEDVGFEYEFGVYKRKG